MADTDKQNFRYPGEKWRQAMEKMAEMRARGYDIDMTKVLSAEVDLVLNESTAATAKRLGLVRTGEPVSAWRKPYARRGGEQ